MRKRSTYKPSNPKPRPPIKNARVDVSAHLAEFIAHTGWTQSEVATYLDCDRTQVSRWMNGHGCAVPAVRPLLRVSTRISVPLLRAVMAAGVPDDGWWVLLRMIGSITRAMAFTGSNERLVAEWKGEQPRTLKRLARLVELAAVFEPAALGSLLDQSSGVPALPAERPDVVQVERETDPVQDKPAYSKADLRAMMVRNLAHHREKGDADQVAKCEAFLARLDNQNLT